MLAGGFGNYVSIASARAHRAHPRPAAPAASATSATPPRSAPSSACSPRPSAPAPTRIARAHRARLARHPPRLRADLRGLHELSRAHERRDARTLPATIVGTERRPRQPRDRRALAHGLRGRRSARRTRATSTRWRPAGPLAHPLFPVCYEWPVALALRDTAIGDARSPLERPRHPSRSSIHRAAARRRHAARRRRAWSPPQPRRAGTLVVARLDDASTPDGDRVTTTDYGSVYRGVALTDAGAPRARRATARPLRRPRRAPRRSAEIRAGASRSTSPRDAAPRLHGVRAHLESDPHRPRGGPRAPGCPHRSCTAPPRWPSPSRAWSRATSAATPRASARSRARFTGMVAMPSTFTVRGRPRGRAGVAFDAVDARRRARPRARES